MKKHKSFLKRALPVLVTAVLSLMPILGIGDSPDNPVGFTVKAVRAQAQRSEVSYFDLAVAPATEHTIEVEIQNQLAEPITLEIALHDASSNPNGLIAYAEGALEPANPGAEDAFTSMAAVRFEGLPVGEGEAIQAIDGNQIVLSGGVAARIPITITAPGERIEGQILGGIVVTRLDEHDPGASSVMTVRSVYSYAIAVQLQADREVHIDPAFTLISVAPSSVVGWPSLTVSIANEAPFVVTGARMRLRLYAADEEAPILDETREPISMAPRSILPYALVLPDSLALPPGDYRMVVNWTYDEETREMEAGFSIPDADTK